MILDDFLRKMWCFHLFEGRYQGNTRKSSAWTVVWHPAWSTADMARSEFCKAASVISTSSACAGVFPSVYIKDPPQKKTLELTCSLQSYDQLVKTKSRFLNWRNLGGTINFHIQVSLQDSPVWGPLGILCCDVHQLLLGFQATASAFLLYHTDSC